MKAIEMNTGCNMKEDSVSFSNAIKEILSDVIELRHDIHESPEMGLKEFKTAELAADTLCEFGCDEVVKGIGGTGVVALIHGERPDNGKTVLFRADMDALPLVEKTGLPYASKTPGVMHACGHDGHVAWALAVAYALTQDRDFSGTAMIVIQPGEEGWAGAKKMIDDGLFTRWDVTEVFAGHCAPELPVGDYGIRVGAMNSIADAFYIDVVGVGGHGARPHRVVDPIVAASELVLALQSIVSRSIDPMHPAVVTIGSINGGNEDGVSVIPEKVRLAGTVRCFYEADQETIIERMTEICEGLSVTTKAQIKLQYDKRYPSLVNAKEQAEAAGRVFSEVASGAVHMDFPASMGAEDFAFMTQIKPGAYIKVGMADATHTANGHNPEFDFNDAVILEAATGFATLISRRLNGTV